MTTLASSPSVTPATRRRRWPQWLTVLGAAARTGRGATGLAITLAILLLASFGPLVAHYSSTALVTAPFAAPSGQFPLGGDVLGRDVLSRVLDGGWQLLIVSASATAFGVIIGAAVGITAAYRRGWVDGMLMRIVDVLGAFPSRVFALLLVSLNGPRLLLVTLAVGITHIPQVARVIRAATLEISERDYVKAVELQGVKPGKVMRAEILPNLMSPLMVEIGLRLTISIILIAGLAFLGFGQAPPAPSWGYMVQENRLGLVLNPWGVIVPAALIAVLTIGLNTFTDSIARVAIGIDRRSEAAVALASTAPQEAFTESALGVVNHPAQADHGSRRGEQ